MRRYRLVLLGFICQLGLSKLNAQDSLNQFKSVPTGLAPENASFLSENVVKGNLIIKDRQSNVKRLPIPLDEYLPRVYDQGGQGACTAFAVAEALSIRANYLNKKRRSKFGDESLTIFSPTYLWVLGNEDRPLGEGCDNPGISYSKAFSTIFKNQLVYWDTYPYPNNNLDLCHDKCPKEVYSKKITDRNFGFDDVILDTGAFKEVLKSGYPICIATDLDMGYYQALYTTKGYWKSKTLPLTHEQHAMVIVDFDDDRRCFKVLDSHGTDKSDSGIIWLNYKLVNRNLDSGAVYGAYIISYDNVTAGPKLEFRNKPSSTSALLLSGTFDSSYITGKISDKNGNPIMGASVIIKGTTIGSSTDQDGRYKIKGFPGATIVASYGGYSAAESELRYDSTEHPSNEYATWTKKGYYRIFNGIRVGVIDLSKPDKTVLLTITDDKTGKLLTSNFELSVGDNASISVEGLELSLTLKGIRHHGNPLNLAKWYSAVIEYKLNTDEQKLTEYF